MKMLSQDNSWLCRWSEDAGAKGVSERVRKVPAEHILQLPAKLHGYIGLVVIMLLIVFMLTIYLKHHFANG